MRLSAARWRAFACDGRAEMSDELRWYWLDSGGLAWVRKNLPGARVERHRRVMFAYRGIQERRDEEAGAVSHRRLPKGAKGGLKTQSCPGRTPLHVFKRRYGSPFQK